MAVDRTTAADIGYGLQRVYTELERRIIVEMSRRLQGGLPTDDGLTRRASGVDEMLRFTDTLLESFRVEGLDQIARALVDAVTRGRFAAGESLRAMLGDASMDEGILRASHVIGGSFPESDVARTMGREALRMLGISDPDAPTDPFSLQRDKTALYQRYLSTLTRGSLELPGSDAIDRIALELSGRLDSTRTHVLRWTRDAYQEVVALQSAAPVLAGIDTRRTGSIEAWNRLLDRGITGFVDARGRNWQLSTYVEMATRTATMGAAIEAHNDQLTAVGIKLVRVSDVAGECPLCRPWEGKILTLTGTGARTLEVPHATDDGTVRVEVAGSLADARAAGLFHPQCRHSISAYLPGLTSALPTAGKTEDPDGNAARVELRSLERQARRARLREAGALDAESKAKARERLKAINGKIDTLIADRGGVERGLPRRRDRERIDLGFKRDRPPRLATPPAAGVQFDSRTPEQRSDAAKRAAATRAANKAAAAAAAAAGLPTPPKATKPKASKATKAPAEPKPPKPPKVTKPKAEPKPKPAKQPAKKAPAKKAEPKPAKATKAPAKKAAKKAPPEVPQVTSTTVTSRTRTGVPTFIGGRPALGLRVPEDNVHDLPPHPDASTDRTAVAAARRAVDAMIERGVHDGSIQLAASEDVRRALYRQAELTPHSVTIMRAMRVPATLAYDEPTQTVVSRRASGMHITGLSPHDGTITINPYWYIADGTDMKQGKRAGIASGWSAPTGYGEGAEVGSTMAHEFGHHLSDLFSHYTGTPSVDAQGNVTGSRAYDERTAARLLPTIARLFGLDTDSPLTGDSLIAAVRHGTIGNLSAPEVPGDSLQAWVYYNRDKIKGRVSEYGASSFDEMLAEIWAEYSTMGAQARPEVREIGRIIAELAEESARRE